MSAFGQGWEAHRRGDELTSNPYVIADWKFWQWEQGFLSFVPAFKD